MEAEDENVVKKNGDGKSSEIKREKIPEAQPKTVKKLQAFRTTPHGNSPVGQDKSLVTDIQVKNNTRLVSSPEQTMKNEVTGQNENTSQEKMKTTTKNVIGKSPAKGCNSEKFNTRDQNSVNQEKSEENIHSKMCKPRSDPSLKSTLYPQNKADSTRANGTKISKSCSDSDRKDMKEIRNKIHSAQTSGKSINAWLYEMDNKNKDRGESNEDSTTFSSHEEELSVKLNELSVADKSSPTKTNTTATEAEDLPEDNKFQSKGPMIGYPKPTNHFQPYTRPNYCQIPPQQVPDFREVEDPEYQFYDEDSLLKALDSIAPETSPNTSPEHISAERLANEISFTEGMPLPNPCPSGINNQYYLNPISQQPVPTPQHTSMSCLSEGLNCNYSPYTQHRSTSADTVVKKESLPISNEPRPNSYPSTQSESIDELFRFASDIIDNDLHETNQTILHNTQQHQESNPQYPSQTIANSPIPRIQPSLNGGIRGYDTHGNKSFTRAIAARPSQIPGQSSQIHPTPQEVTVQTTQLIRPIGGNLPNILHDVMDNTTHAKIQARKTSPLPQNTKVNNNTFMKESQVMQQLPVATQIMGVSSGSPQKLSTSQNPVVFKESSLMPVPDGVSSVKVSTLLPNQGGQNPMQRNELNSSKSSQSSLNVRPMHPSTSIVEGKVFSMPQTMLQNVPVQQGLSTIQSPFPDTSMNYTTSQLVCDPQKRAQQTITSYPMHQHPNAGGMPINNYTIQNGGLMPDSSVTQLIGGPCGPQPLNVIFYPPLPNNKPKPRYRKILPKPTPPVEGGK